ncbi:DUF1365 domain-containing protein [Lentzea sp. NBC_00516]|uniref:DUF1365 domain-containing protein n=1 Tax=Lentzea sp. NBC_00516 TaxID=2903582 RepID=UPI002E80C520|nr:DUF1365 domain-containing protein [Lentzea sp. NBC_00516]WUD29286.1 DUF1365 domain-containing protein [Lentzea sp. NBC_00516]
MSGLPALYVGHVVHVRHDPTLRVFRQRICLWLVDLDALPVLPLLVRPLAGFRATDHLGEPRRLMRAAVDEWLAARDIDLEGGQIIMLGAARVLGHVFNPITVYWCHGPDGVLRCVIAEVGNTYGEKHRYLVGIGESDVEKSFYVSPFLPMEGSYRMRLPLPDDLASLTVALRSDERLLLTAVLTAHRRPATPRELIRQLSTGALLPLRVSALIRAHGTVLRLKGFRRTRRPRHEEGES